MRFLRLLEILTCLLLSLEFSASALADEPKFARTEDVIYGRKFGTALTMDIFKPEHQNKAAIVMVVSGGWFSAHEGIKVEYIKEALKRGYTVFTVVHGSQPKFTIPEILADMNRSIRFIRHHADEYGIDRDRIGIMGGSAGGHLSLMQGTAGKDGDSKAPDPVDRESSRVQAVACLFPPTDFLNYGKPGENALGRGILKDFKSAFDFADFDQAAHRFVPVTDESKILEIGKDISPVNHATADDPPTLIVHGDADVLVPLQQSQLIIDKLDKLGVKTKLVIKPSAGHGWPDMSPELSQLIDWFDETMAEKKDQNGDK